MTGTTPTTPATPPMYRVHPIETESYRILADRIDLSGHPPGAAAVIARIIHASADLEFADLTIVDDDAVAAGVGAIATGAPVVCDVQMVRAGITAIDAVCLLGEARAGPGGTPTRSANAMALAANRWPKGAVFVVGCAPTALVELTRLIERGDLHPALVIGVPVGFVGAAESKEALRRIAGHGAADCRVPTITTVGEKGGSAVAAAAFNALARLARSGAALSGTARPDSPDPSPST